MKRITSLFFVFLVSAIALFADEGMWQPYMLNNQTIAEMQKLGCKLTPEQIFSLNQPSIKDAIVQFGGGCTGEIISDQGLLLTNHHCGIGYVQSHSSVDHDYLTDGFWAYNKNEELPNDGLKVYFLNNVYDVTKDILKGVTDDLDEIERAEKINANKSSIIEEAKGDRNVTIEIVPFYAGNQYILFEYNVYSDVRLVACPPWGIGKYGADTDNWTWPRHKGDFCIFRVYTAPDGSPADYSEDNIPLKPKYSLPISIKGINEGDYAMILGYPGSTDRYSSSQSVRLLMEHSAPATVKCRTEKLKVYRKHMDADKEVFIKYASKQASVSNYWKYYIGQIKQLKRNKVVERRIQQEQEFRRWVNADKSRSEKYKDVLPAFNEQYKIASKYQKALTYYVEAGIFGSEAIKQSYRFNTINKLLEDKNKDDAINRLNSMKNNIETYFSDYDYNLDKEATTVLLNLFYNDIPSEYRPELINKIGGKDNGDFAKYVDKAFNKSIFTCQDRMNKWLENPKKLSKDPIFELMTSFLEGYINIIKQASEASIVGRKASRLYMEGLMEMYADEVNFYPDANFTMRLTYGSIESYKPFDGATYNFESTIDGVMEKYIPNNWEFDLPKDLINLYNKKDYGEYANANGDLIVNFISTNDITGGNSGSPVLDGEGNLIGLAFDGNWEAMSGDISFENEVQRTISVDIRYVLFVIEKLGKAQNILDELNIIR